MFILPTFLSLWNISRFKLFEISGLTFQKQLIQDNLNDLLNEGINTTTFAQFFGDIPFFCFIYDRFINFLSDPNLIISRSAHYKISQYINADQDLYSIRPEINEWFLSNRNRFIELRKIISEVGPHLCTTLNLDFDVLILLYDYVFINDENDGVLIGNVLNFLQLPTDILQQLSKVLSFFDNKKPIIELFDGLQVKPQYLKFINKVQLLKIPIDDNEKFFSVIRIIDVFSSFVDIIRGIHQNFFVKIENGVVKPILKTYLINPINIFDVSIHDRAVELELALNIVQQYSSSCSFSNSSDNVSLECIFYQKVQSLLRTYICDDNDSCQADDVFTKAKILLSDFTNQKANLSQILIVKYKIPENHIKFIFGLMENLTSINKTYLDLLQGLTLISPTNKTISIFNYHDVQFETFVTNVTNLVNFIINIKPSSNIKEAFDYLNRTHQWHHLKFLVNSIIQNKTICDLHKCTEKVCNDAFNSISKISKILISNESIIESIPEEYLDYVINGLIPLLHSIKFDVSQFVSGCYNLTMLYSEKVNYANFTLFIKRNGKLFDKIITTFDSFVPEIYKKLPFIGDRYRQFIHKAHNVLNILKENGQTVPLFYSMFGKFGVVAQMLVNGISMYRNENTTVMTITKAIKPTSFLNTFQTAFNLSKLNGLRISDVANSIAYDSDSKFSFNTIIPIKTMSENAKLLAGEMTNNALKFESLAKALGKDKKQLKQILISFANYVLSSPSKLVRDVAISEGYDSEEVDQYLTKIRNFSQKVSLGKQVDFNTKIYWKNLKDKKQLSSPVVIGIAIVAFVVASAAAALTIYFVHKRNKADAENYLVSQQTMLVVN